MRLEVQKLTRRAMLAVAATLPVSSDLPNAMAKAEPANDPIFAAIAAHIEAVKAFNSLPENIGQMIEVEACNRTNSILEILVEIQPVTLSGIAALLDHILRFDSFGLLPHSHSATAVRTIIEALNKMETAK